MADVIPVTMQPIRLTGTVRQERYLAIDVSRYDILDFELYCAAVEGTSPSATVKIITSMQTQTDTDGWADLVTTFSAMTASNSSQVKSASTGILRYIRWECSAFSGSASPAVTFWLRAMGRSYS